MAPESNPLSCKIKFFFLPWLKSMDCSFTIKANWGRGGGGGGGGGGGLQLISGF